MAVRINTKNSILIKSKKPKKPKEIGKSGKDTPVNFLELKRVAKMKAAYRDAQIKRALQKRQKE